MTKWLIRIGEDKLPIKNKFYCHKLFQGRGYFSNLNNLNWGGVCDISDAYIHLKVFFSSQIFCWLTMLKRLLNIQSLLMVRLHGVSFVIRGLVSFSLKEMTQTQAHLERALFRRQWIESAVCQIFLCKQAEEQKLGACELMSDREHNYISVTFASGATPKSLGLERRR